MWEFQPLTRPKRGRGGRGRGIYPTWASGVYLTGGGVYLTKVVSCYPFPIFFTMFRVISTER